jgi:phosphoribosylformylglycinamidine (FGAM) synthase PurS component
MKTKLLVGLKIPDTTAITTHNAMKKLGYKVGKLKRRVYYEFDKDVSSKAAKIDILVNSNKNTAEFPDNLPKNSVLVKDLDADNSGLVDTLKKLGLDIKSVEVGILWIFEGADEPTIKCSAEELLYNKHYQEVEYY